MRRGVRLGVDVGRVRVGVARSDPDGIMALPLSTLRRDDDATGRLREMVAEYGAIEVIVGLPVSLAGASTASTDDAVGFARGLVGAVTVPVRLIDERLSTVSAQSMLRDNGRTSRDSRSVVDQVAAVIILQNALDSERSAGQPAGVLVERDEGQG